MIDVGLLSSGSSGLSSYSRVGAKVDTSSSFKMELGPSLLVGSPAISRLPSTSAILSNSGVSGRILPSPAVTSTNISGEFDPPVSVEAENKLSESYIPDASVNDVYPLLEYSQLPFDAPFAMHGESSSGLSFSSDASGVSVSVGIVSQDGFEFPSSLFGFLDVSNLSSSLGDDSSVVIPVVDGSFVPPPLTFDDSPGENLSISGENLVGLFPVDGVAPSTEKTISALTGSVILSDKPFVPSLVSPSTVSGVAPEVFSVSASGVLSVPRSIIDLFVSSHGKMHINKPLFDFSHNPVFSSPLPNSNPFSVGSSAMLPSVLVGVFTSENDGSHSPSNNLLAPSPRVAVDQSFVPPPQVKSQAERAAYHAHQLDGLIRASIKDGIRSLTVQLKPAELGRIDIRISDIAGDITLVIRSEKSETQDLLASSSNLLRHDLKESFNSLDMHFGKNRPPEDASNLLSSEVNTDNGSSMLDGVQSEPDRLLSINV